MQQLHVERTRYDFAGAYPWRHLVKSTLRANLVPLRQVPLHGGPAKVGPPVKELDSQHPTLLCMRYRETGPCGPPTLLPIYVIPTSATKRECKAKRASARKRRKTSCGQAVQSKLDPNGTTRDRRSQGISERARGEGRKNAGENSKTEDAAAKSRHIFIAAYIASVCQCG